MPIKKTLESQYREILSGYGKRLEDCKVFAFRFEDPSGPERFHFRLMGRVAYHLFDCIGTLAIIITEEEQNMTEIAASLGGIKQNSNVWKTI